MTRPEKDQFKKPFYERKDGKPVSAEDAVRMKAKMLLEMKVKKITDEAEQRKNEPVKKTDQQKEEERIARLRAQAPRHLRSEG